MKVRCLIDHCGVVFSGKVYEVLDTEHSTKYGLRVKIEGSDGGPVWLGINYNGIVEYEVLSKEIQRMGLQREAN